MSYPSSLPFQCVYAETQSPLDSKRVNIDRWNHIAIADRICNLREHTCVILIRQIIGNKVFIVLQTYKYEFNVYKYAFFFCS